MTFSNERHRGRTRLALLASASLVALGLAAAPATLDLDLGLVAKAAQAGSCCFRAGTRVRMADGSERPIESLRVGDRVVGRSGRINTVLGVERTRLGRRRLWSINGSRPFVTAEHPFLGTNGWYAIDPAATAAENPLLPVAALARGHRLVRSVPAAAPGSRGALALAVQPEPVEEPVEITALVAVVYAEDLPLYNLRLDGDHTYLADGWVVHNKGGGDGGSSGGDDDGDDGGDDDDGPSGGGSGSDDDDSGSGGGHGGSDDDSDSDDDDSGSGDDHSESDDDDSDSDDDSDDDGGSDDRSGSDDDDSDEDGSDDGSDEQDDASEDASDDADDPEADEEDVAADDEEDEPDDASDDEEGDGEDAEEDREDVAAGDDDEEDDRPSGPAAPSTVTADRDGGSGGVELSLDEERAAVAGGWR